MPSTWTSNLSIEKPATGEQAGVWGSTCNNNFDYLDTGIDGNITIRLSASGYDLVTGTGLSEGRNKVVIFTGALTAAGTINIKPNTAQKVYFVVNHTTGGFSLRFTQGTGSSFILQANQSAVIYADGLGNAASVFGVLNDLQVNSLLVISSLVVQGQISFTGAQTVPVAMAFTGGVTISPPPTGPSLILNLGSDAAYDMYYRSAAPGGPTTRLAIGSPGYVLTVGGSGPAWLAPAVVGIGSGISGAAPSQVLFTDAAKNLAQSANLQYTTSAGLSIGRSPATGYGLTIGTPGKIMLDSAKDNIREIVYATSSTPRWSWRLIGDAESGNNNGASFSLVAFDDNGSPLSYPIYCSRLGHTTIGTNFDYATALTVVGTAAANDVLSVRAAPAQTGKLQSWYGTTGLVAWLGNDGTFFSNVPSDVLKFDVNRRVDINGTITGHPLGTIHLGANTDAGAASGSPNPCIAFEAATGNGNVGPSNMARLYFRASPNPQKFVLQFYTGSGAAMYAYLDLANAVIGQPMTWFLTTNPV